MDDRELESLLYQLNIGGAPMKECAALMRVFFP